MFSYYGPDHLLPYSIYNIETIEKNIAFLLVNIQSKKQEKIPKATSKFESKDFGMDWDTRKGVINYNS